MQNCQIAIPLCQSNIQQILSQVRSVKRGITGVYVFTLLNIKFFGQKRTIQQISVTGLVLSMCQVAYNFLMKYRSYLAQLEYVIKPHVRLYQHISIPMIILWYSSKCQADYALILSWISLIAAEDMMNIFLNHFSFFP